MGGEVAGRPGDAIGHQWYRARLRVGRAVPSRDQLGVWIRGAGLQFLPARRVPAACGDLGAPIEPAPGGPGVARSPEGTELLPGRFELRGSPQLPRRGLARAARAVGTGPGRIHPGATRLFDFQHEPSVCSACPAGKRLAPAKSESCPLGRTVSRGRVLLFRFSLPCA